MSTKKYKIILNNTINIGKFSSDLISNKGTVSKTDLKGTKSLVCSFPTKTDDVFKGTKMMDQSAKYILLKRTANSDVIQAYPVDNWYRFDKQSNFQTFSSEQVEEYLKMREKMTQADFNKAIESRTKPLTIELDESDDGPKHLLGKKRKAEEPDEAPLEEADLESLFNDEKGSEAAGSSSEDSIVADDSFDSDASLGDIEKEDNLFDDSKKKKNRPSQKQLDDDIFQQLCHEGMRKLFKASYVAIKDFLIEKKVDESSIVAKLGGFLENNCRKFTEKKETLYMLK